jgi:ABC-2 type transport system permease protein
MMFSSFSSEKGRVSFLTGGILVLMYVLNVLAGLKESLINLRYFSFFYYYNPGNALGDGKLVDWSIVVFAGVIIVSTLVAARYFSRRDIAV